jgi:hypothetical protein
MDLRFSFEGRPRPSLLFTEVLINLVDVAEAPLNSKNADAFKDHRSSPASGLETFSILLVLGVLQTPWTKQHGTHKEMGFDY